MPSKLNILCIGDIVGRPGRQLLRSLLTDLKAEYNIDFTVANIENAAGGKGITPKVYDELSGYGIDAFTGGNHIYAQKESLKHFETWDKLIRPLNFPPKNPGVGFRLFECAGTQIAIINLIGRVFMGPNDCPFRAIENILSEIKAPIILVDMHGEATSEKEAMGWFLDGDVSCVFGTHTHVMTADERVLPNGCGYISDIGMTGPYDAILGVTKEIVINRFLTGMPAHFEPDKTSPTSIFNGIRLIIDTKSGKIESIERVHRVVKTS